MDTRTASPPDAHTVSTVIGDPQFDHDSVPDKISAYYSLVFPNFTYYLQTLNVTIGRRCIPTSTASSSEQVQVDVDLGPLKSVSRLHAKIEYEEEEERFMLLVLGRNGAWVDGMWSGKGSKVPLSERSQIQIASRTFHFVLPPPPAPEDSPSPSSQSSVNRPRSPSVDITSISPPSSLQSNSPPAPISPTHKAPPLPDPPQLPNTNVIGKVKQPKKRKASDVDAQPRPKPEVMPPKPQFTYAQLCYRAIKALDGKATLQDIISWMMENYDWYRYNEKTGWEKSVRHNLSSNRAFRKMERSAGERGKGFYWTVAEDCEQMFEEQETKLSAAASGSAVNHPKQSGKKPKGGASLSEPPLKRSVRGEAKGAPLPPPLTSTPLAFKSVTPASAPSASTPAASAPVIKSEPSPAPPIPPPPQPHTGPDAPGNSTHAASPPPPPLAAAAASPNISSSIPPSGIPPIPASVIIPIIVGPVPASHPAASAPVPSTSNGSGISHLATPPIVLHENQLILNPAIFSHLTPEQLREIEALGAQKALEVLHGHIVRFLKERIKTEAARGRGRGRGKRALGGVGRGGKDGGAGAQGREEKKEKVPTSGLFTTEPLRMRKAQQPAASVQTAPPMSSLSQPTDIRPPSPILVVDDDPPEGPVPKRRRLDTLAASGIGSASAVA